MSLRTESTNKISCQRTKLLKEYVKDKEPIVMSTVNVWVLHNSHRMSFFKGTGTYLNSTAVFVLTHPMTYPTIDR